jgi:hypothetical protein
LEHKCQRLKIKLKRRAATLALRMAQSLSGWQPGDERCKPPRGVGVAYNFRFLLNHPGSANRIHTAIWQQAAFLKDLLFKVAVVFRSLHGGKTDARHALFSRSLASTTVRSCRARPHVGCGSGLALSDTAELAFAEQDNEKAKSCSPMKPIEAVLFNHRTVPLRQNQSERDDKYRQ